jgi:hypothetical protein
MVTRREFVGGVTALSLSAFLDCSGLARKEGLLLAATSTTEDQRLSFSSHTKFRREFAPSEMYVKAPERSFRDDICLSGLWQFQPLSLPADFRQGIDPAPELPPPALNGWEHVPIKIPSPWNVNGFAEAKGQGGDFRNYPSYPAAWQNIQMGWLRHHLTVPVAWRGRRILLHFDAAAGDLQIQINGKDVGRQFDLFFPFDLDVTDTVRFGDSNEILVGVRKASLSDVNGEYGRRTYQGGSFWGQHVVGIWQDIFLVAVPAGRVHDVFVQPQVDRNILKVEVTLRNDDSTDMEVDVSGIVYPWISQACKDESDEADPKWKLGEASVLRLPSSRVTVPARGEKTVFLQQRVGASLRFWLPEEPMLYGLMIDVRHHGRVVDEKYTRFGWRQITFSGDRILLNNKQLVLKGDSWHFMGIPQMTRRYAHAWFRALRDAHLNAVRLHAQPYPKFYLDVADEMGILVLDETAIWASDGGPKLDSDVFWKDTVSHVEQLVRRDRNHPSVFGWSVCNEVKPIVQNVFHGPPEMLEKLIAYYAIWADTCRRLDPTRQWISADGDDDGFGRLPTSMVHYGGTEALERASKSDKPWGVGEAGNAYYATPEQVAKTNGEQAYESFLGRMEGVAIDSYQNLLLQKKFNADYRSIFNLVWYGLQPLPLGMTDISRPPTLKEGIFFLPCVEGRPGVQPERLGPYSTTLNPGYDPALPSYRTWPLFDAIRDAQTEPTIALPSTPSIYSPAPVVSSRTSVESVVVLSSPDGKLQMQLATEGVPFDHLKPKEISNLVFVDGNNPPDANARQTMDQTLAAGGTVVVWGVSQETLPRLNVLLPKPIELTTRKSSSLVRVTSSRVTDELKLSDMYFSELSPPIILDGGLAGPLIEQSSVLLEACNTDWLKWNKQPEYAKTAMILRSECEEKPSGAALVEFKQGNGRLLVCNLPAASNLYKVQSMVRRILKNLGIPLLAPVDVGEPFLKNGKLIRVLGCGRFPLLGDSNVEKMIVDPTSGGSMRENNRIGDRRWVNLASDEGLFDFSQPPLSGPGEEDVVYLSFWIHSPRSLDNLLLEPNLPKLDLNFQTKDTLELFLNAKSIFKQRGVATAQSLPLRQGWNHSLIRLIHGKGDDKFSARLTCNDAEFLNSIQSAQQKN